MSYRHNIIRALLLSVLMVNCVVASSQEPRRLVILHTNDLHSRLDGYAPSSEYSPLVSGDDKTKGGFSRLASVISRESREYPSATLVLDAGDFLMGTFYHYMEEFNPFQLSLMKKMGYDDVALGNHEFDYGPDRLAGIIENSAASAAVPQLLLGNVVFDDRDEADDELQELFRKDIIKRYMIIEKNGLRTGIFSLMGEDAEDVAPYAEPVSFSKIRRSAKKISGELRKQGCDIIICLSHSGIEKDDEGNWSGEDIDLAKKTDDIDIIISGHTHTMLEQPLMINNTLVVQTGSYGQYLGKLELEHKDGKPVMTGYELIEIDDNIQGDRAVQEAVNVQKKLISEKLYDITGYRVDDKIVRTPFKLECNEYGGLKESNLGPLVADAIYDYVNSRSRHGCDISMVAAGVIRDNVEPGIQTTQDIFRIMSLGSGDDDIPGYPLARVYVNAKELKRVLEILLVAYKSSPSNYIYYSGLEVEYDPDKGLLRKIKSIAIRSGDGKMTTVDISRDNDNLYSIAANSYMLEFIGIIRKMTFGLVKVKPKDINGKVISDMSSVIIDFDHAAGGLQEGKEWIALVKYLSSMPDRDNDGIPDLDPKYENPGLALIPVH